MLKTNKSVAKRMRWTAKRKIKRSRACKGHLLTHKSRRQKNALKKAAYVDKADYAKIRRMLPYG
jgi:large subunit ribosomal protein L35